MGSRRFALQIGYCDWGFKTFLPKSTHIDLSIQAVPRLHMKLEVRWIIIGVWKNFWHLVNSTRCFSFSFPFVLLVNAAQNHGAHFRHTTCKIKPFFHFYPAFGSVIQVISVYYDCGSRPNLTITSAWDVNCAKFSWWNEFFPDSSLTVNISK